MNHAQVNIDLKAIAANIRRIKASTNSQILAVVKADAYGHGLVPVANTALASGATWLGVALLEEGLTLRKTGIRARIIAWLTPPGDDFDLAIANGIDLSVPSIKILHEIVAAARSLGITPRVHIEVDTGMSRGGFLDEWPDFLREIVALKDELSIVGIWSHFARADEPEEPANIEQMKAFTKRVEQLRSVGISPSVIHFSNSAATLVNPSAHHDLVRIGIAMYGLSPDVVALGSSTSLELTPAMHLQAKLHLVKKVPAGSAVGYGGTAVLTKNTKLGVIAMGYADGIPRNTSSEAAVFIHTKSGGKLAPLVGRVSMDQFVVDLGSRSTAQAGDWVDVFGGAGQSVDDWARASGTINYEIVTRIAARVPRIYLR